MGRPLLDITGQHFGFLRPIAPVDQTPAGSVIWLCYCEACDGSAKISAGNLRSGGTTSCGCRRTKHQANRKGLRHPLYQVWADMKKRCCNPGHNQYKDYGGRGIKVHEAWHDYDVFRDYMLSLKNCPAQIESPGFKTTHYIDRHPDNDGNYEPGNVRWATRGQNNNNRRSSKFFIVNGEKMSMKQACEKVGRASYDVVRDRLDKDWPVRKAFLTPSKGK